MRLLNQWRPSYGTWGISLLGFFKSESFWGIVLLGFVFQFEIKEKAHAPE